ncbi:hypothetical protein TNCV_390671 [Trichonephila clavipes]|nr:hypothetical protein TNCV_390671 [Trichonephila clavipes]
MKVLEGPSGYSLFLPEPLQLRLVMVSDGSPGNSSLQMARCTPVVSQSFQRHTSDWKIGLGYTPIFEVKHPGGGQSCSLQ